MGRGPNLEQVQAALKLPRPGLKAQLYMAPNPRPGGHIVPPGHQPKEGGVLILLYPRRAQLHLALTRRTDTVAHHKGQISLPGGEREPHDGSLKMTALRETQEELGIETGGLQVLGTLTPLYIPVSDYCIYPYIASSEERPGFHPDPVEVAEVLEVPLSQLMDPATRQVEDWVVRGFPMRVPFFAVGVHKVWGATAMVLSEFVALLRSSVPSARGSDPFDPPKGLRHSYDYPPATSC